MPDRFTWYSFDEMTPKDRDWVLIADDRFKTPKKARYRSDCVDRLDYDDGKTLDCDYPWEHAYAWMPLPPMPSREMVDSNADVSMESHDCDYPECGGCDG